MGIKRSRSRGCSRRTWYISSSILTSMVLLSPEQVVTGFSQAPSVTSKVQTMKFPARSTLKRLPEYPALQSPHNYFGTTLCLKSKESDDLGDETFRQKTPCENAIVFAGNESFNLQTVFASMLLGLVLVFSGPVPDANAGFGPSSRAAASPPPNLIAPNVENTNAKKLKQLIGSSLNKESLLEFNRQLENITEELKKLLVMEEPEEGEEAPVVDMTIQREREAELGRAQLLQTQIADREKILGVLQNQPYWFNYLAAFVGSLASTLVMHPVDTIKTRLQLKQSVDGEEEDDEDSGHNFLSLYEGLSANILKEGPPSALYLGVYESVKYSLLPRFGPQSVLLVYLLSGAAGEMVGSVVRAPAEAIKSTVQSGRAGSALEAVTQVFGTSESRANVVRAWSASIWRDVPFGAIQLAVFELIKSYILNNADIDFDSGTLLSEALIGAFAGGFGAFLTNPFDIITTRIITQEVEGDNEPLGVVDMGMKLYNDGGPGAFLVGWQARVGYWAPAISIFLTCYCSVRQAGVMHGWFTN